jgi:hypothetical protein
VHLAQEGFSKTFLFVILAVADGILSNVVYVPPKLYQNRPPTPAHLAAQTIWCLLHLSDIVAALGGVSPTSGGGVKELQRTFHFAVDILCDPNSGARETLPAFVRDICGVAIEKTERMSVVLNIIEFLVPVLLDSAEGRSILDGVVWNACKM